MARGRLDLVTVEILVLFMGHLAVESLIRMNMGPLTVRSVLAVRPLGPSLAL